MITKLTNLEKAALLGGKSVWETRAIARLGISSVFMSDGPHGVRRQLGSSDHLGLNEAQPATCFPTSATLANSWDQALAEQIGVALGKEAAAAGVDVLLGPGLNMKRSPLGGRNFEYFAEDPYLSGKLAAAYIRGVQSTGTAATPKHFAVNNQELRRMASDSVLDERTLREIYLTAFEIAVRQGRPRALMSSYNLVNGCYAHENKHLLTEILRAEWGFDGAVVTDWGGGNDPVAGVAAGGSLEMPAAGFDAARRIVDAVNAGELAVADLDARAAEIVQLALDAQLRVPVAVDHDQHHELAKLAVERSIVLLRNNDALLPLPPATSVALIGDMAITPRYQGAGSSQVNPTRLVSAVEAIKATDLNVVGVAPGYRRDRKPDAGLLAEAVELAKRVEVVLVFVGLDEISESEGLDRTDIDLPTNQTELLAALAAVNPNVVAVLSAGSVVATDWVEHTAALVHSYLGGQAGAEAVLRVLTGAVNPAGKLAETYPLALADTPTAGEFPAAGRYAVYREGLFVGYRHYDAAGLQVRYPFGYGLSYSTFEYTDLSVDDTAAQFTITNTSAVAGDEIAQLYVGLPTSKLVRPVKELKGFARVHLEPGESVRVQIDFDEYTWRHFDVPLDSWQTEKGLWQVMIGASSSDIRLVGTLKRDGIVPAPAELPEFPTEPDAGPRRVLTIADPLLAMASARSPLARLAHRILRRNKNRAEASGVPDLNTQFIFNMPFRAIAKMTNGQVSLAMVDGIVTIVNGHFWRGLRVVITEYFANRRDNKSVARHLAAAASTGRTER